MKADGNSADAGRLSRRADLQGLRAVAVLIVALNHARISFLPGGYVGVDVFFVLSGYFITRLLLRDAFNAAGADGRARVSLSQFYARRARRILPAACLTVIAVSIAVYIVYDLNNANYLDTKPTLLDAMSASLFYANIHFAAASTNYFASFTSTFPSPFQHFWSLSVEEQFYLVWPTLLLCAFFVAKRLGLRGGSAGGSAADVERRAARRIIGLLLVVICGISLYFSVHETKVNAAAAYFDTSTRIWELGIGAAMALLVPDVPPIAKSLQAVLAWLGLAMIAAAALFFTASTPFPGYAALLPVGGAALIVLGGTARGSSEILLRLKPLTFIGDRSYGFYLWHYPALIIVWQASGHYTSTVVNLLLLLGAFALASLTYTLYENPLRFAGWLRGWKTAVMAPAALAVTLAAILIPVQAVDNALAAQTKTSGAGPAPLAAAVGQPARANLWSYKPIPAVVSAVSASLADKPLPAYSPSIAELQDHEAPTSYAIPNACVPNWNAPKPASICHLGDTKAKQVVVIIGDSHAGMWMPGLVVAGKIDHFQIIHLGKPGCGYWRQHWTATQPCEQWLKWALAEDRRLHPTVTLVTYEVVGHPSWTAAHLEVEAHDNLTLLKEVKNGVLLADPPNDNYGATVDPPGDCLIKPGATMATCAARVPAWYLTLAKQLQTLATSNGFTALPTMQWFCDRNVCPMVINNTITTIDGNHLSGMYSHELGPLFAREFEPVLRKFEAKSS